MPLKGGGEDLARQKGKANHEKVYHEYSHPVHPLEKDHKYKCSPFAEDIIIINFQGGGEATEVLKTGGARMRRYTVREPLHSKFTG